MKKILFATMVLSLALLSCGKDSVTPDAPTGDLKVGTKWVYRYTDLNENGTVAATQDYTITVTAQQTLGTQVWWVISNGTASALIRKAADGWHTFKNSADQLEFKVPAVLNDTWRVTFSSSAGDYEDYTVKTLAQSVTVPFGTVACYYSEGFDSNSLEDKKWYNELNILIKHEEYDQNAAGTLYVDYKEELVSYTP